MDRKLVLPLILAILAGISYFLSYTKLFNVACTGIVGWINPLCWINTTFSFFMVILAIILAVSAIIFFLVKDTQMRWLITFIFFVAIAFINWVTPDVIPFIDEIILTVTAAISGWKSMNATENKENVF